MKYVQFHLRQVSEFRFELNVNWNPVWMQFRLNSSYIITQMKWMWNWSKLKISVFDHQNHRCLSASLFPCCPSHSMLVFLFCFFLHWFLNVVLLSRSIISSSRLLSSHEFPSVTLSFSSHDEASRPFHHFNHHPLKREKVVMSKTIKITVLMVTPSFLWVGAFWCFLTSMYVHAFNSVKRCNLGNSSVHIHVFSLPVSWHATENVRLWV